MQFLRDAVAYYNRLGVTIKRPLTDNGSAFRSQSFKAACEFQHKFTRAYRPQTPAPIDAASVALVTATPCSPQAGFPSPVEDNAGTRIDLNQVLTQAT